MSDEHELLARARRFDQAALGRIHDEYYGPLFRYALYRTGDPETAQDIASDVLMRLLEGLRAGTGPTATLAGWLFSVAARVVSDHFRLAYRACRGSHRCPNWWCPNACCTALHIEGLHRWLSYRQTLDNRGTCDLPLCVKPWCEDS